MAVARRVNGFNVNNSGASNSVTLSASLQVGDLVLLVLAQANLEAISDPTGWTRLVNPQGHTNGQMVVWRKTLVAGDPGATVTASWTTGGKSILQYFGYSGAKANTIFAAAGAGETVSQTTHKCPNASSLPANCWAFETVMDRASSSSTGWTAPGTITKFTDQITTGGGSVSAGAGDSNGVVASGAYTGGTWTGTIVTDNANMATVIIEPTAAGNAAPSANAGPDQSGIAAGATVTLDGSASSDSDGTVVGYAWTQTSGTTVTLSSTTAVQPTFTAPSSVNAQTLVFSLTVTDNGGATSTADTVQIGVLGTGTGTAGYRDGVMTNGSGATATLTTPSTVVAGDVELLFLDVYTQVAVADPAGFTRISASNIGTIAQTVAWRRTALGGDPSTAVPVSWGDGTTLAKWNLTMEVYKNVNATLADVQALVGSTTGTTHATPSLTVATAGSWVVSHYMETGSPPSTSATPSVGLTGRHNFAQSGQTAVTSGTADSSSSVATGTHSGDTWAGTVSTVTFASVGVTLAPVAGANQPPVANAGPDQSGIEPGTRVQLTGVASTDSDGTVASYLWRFISGMATGPTLSSTTSVSPTFLAPSVLGGVTLTFGLIVTDNLGLAGTEDTVQITVLTATEFLAHGGNWVGMASRLPHGGVWN